MKWSWKIGEFAGIGVFIHVTFLLLIGWVGLVHWLEGKTIQAVASGVGFILAIFTCVVFHEFGHALAARRYGIKTRDITLLPIGGVARLERMPDNPREELWVALAGPAVNLVIALALYLWLTLTSTWEPLQSLRVHAGSFMERLLVVNVILAGFNLLPAFPMDGGRVLRALLATRMDYARATQIAAGIGQAVALFFGFLGLFMNPFLLFIALFVWIGASQEAGMAQMKSALGGIPVSRAMLTDFRTVSPSDSLGRAVDLILAGSQQDFPVIENGSVVGVLLRADVFSTLARGGQDSPISQVMRRDFQAVDPGDMLDATFQKLQACACHTVPVTRQGKIAGLLTMDNLGEFILIQGALSAAQRRTR